jgi:hypothetical protein
MAHGLRFDEHVRRAGMLARRITGVEEPAELLWLNAVTVEAGADIGEIMDTPDGDPDAQEAVMADFLADELGDDPELPTTLEDLGLEPSMEGHTDAVVTAYQDIIDNDSGSDTDIEVIEDAMDVEVSEPPRPISVPTTVIWSEMVRIKFS